MTGHTAASDIMLAELRLMTVATLLILLTDSAHLLFPWLTSHAVTRSE